MLETPAIEQAVHEAVRSTIKGRNLSRVLVEPAVDSQGEDALGVTVVIHDADEVTGDDALDTIFGIDRVLQRMGDSRLAITRFATETEMAMNGDSES